MVRLLSGYRIRASRRAGELIAEGQKCGEIASQGQQNDAFNKKVTSTQTRLLPDEKEKPKTLPQLGITHDQSSQWKELAGSGFT